MAPTPRQAHLIAELKDGQPAELSIPIRSGDGAALGRLVPVTGSLAEDQSIIDALYRWRKANMTSFLTVFEPTLEKTRRYLTAFSLPDPARILFLVHDSRGRVVGHIGLCNISADSAEIDNVLRGEAIDAPDFMPCAHRAILEWAFAELDVPLAYLNVLAGNTRAIRSYRKVGFVESGRIPLARRDTDGGYNLVPANDAPHVAMLIRMELSRDSFVPNHGGPA